ncbi:MAG TPA: alpha/beta hydrolase [Kineosporiaceae bacterium]
MGRLSRFVRDELTFDVRDGGPGDGEAVVLLHGFPQDASCWDAVVPALHDVGLRTLAPDQRGYSPGARPAAVQAYRASEIVADVLALLDAAQVRRAHVVGHDWGGTIAWALAGQHPDRVHTLTVLSTPHPEAFARAVRSGSQALRSWYLVALQLPRVPELLLPHLLGGFLARSGMPAPEVERVLARLHEPGALAGAVAWYRALRFARREHFPTVRVPTTFVWGRHDPALGRVGAELTRDAVSAPYRFVELDAGHWLPETRPVQVSSVVLDRIRTVAQT